MPRIDVLALKALTLEYEISPGVVFKAGEKFTEDPWYNYVSWTEWRWRAFSPWGEVLPYHWQLERYGWNGTYDEDYDDISKLADEWLLRSWLYGL